MSGFLVARARDGRIGRKEAQKSQKAGSDVSEQPGLCRDKGEALSN